MCSIMGYCGVCDDLEAFQKGFAKTISRGPDDSRIVDTGMVCLDSTDLRLWGLRHPGCSRFHWVAVMWYAMERFSDLSG